MNYSFPYDRGLVTAAWPSSEGCKPPHSTTPSCEVRA